MRINKTLLIGLVLLLSFNMVLALDGYSKYKVLDINETSGNTLNDYSVLLEIDYDSDMQNDFDDVKFTEDDNTTLLNFYIEDKNDGVNATIWVLMPTLTASSTTNIIMWYGNSSVSTTSSFNDAFLYADDFNSDTSDRYINDSGCSQPVTVSGGGFLIASVTNAEICSIVPNLTYQLINESYAIESRLSLGSSDAYLVGLGGLDSDTLGSTTAFESTGYNIWISNGYSPTFSIAGFNSGFYNISSATSLTPNTWNELSVYFDSSNLITASYTNNSGYNEILTDSAFGHGSVGYYGITMYGDGSNEGNATFDWYRVRPYATNEPTYTFGSEQSTTEIEPEPTCFVVSQTGNYSITGGVIIANSDSPFLGKNVNITYDYAFLTSGITGEVVDDTNESLASVSSWFAIIITITVMVTLILLTILIIRAIRPISMDTA